MITRKEIDIIRAMLLQPHGAKLIPITIFGGTRSTNLKVTDYAHTLLTFYGTQYSQAHPEISYKGKPNGKMGLSRFITVMTRYFAEQEPWIWKDDPTLDKYKYHVDLLYAVQCVKKILNGYIPDTKLRTQSDTLIALIGWNIARIRENADGEECRGFIDYEYENNGEHEQEPTPSPICVPVIIEPVKNIPVIQPILISPDNGKKQPNLIDLDDLFEETPLPTDFLRRGK